MTFNIPSNVDEYLKYHYGETWRIPRKNWDWVKDDRAQNWLSVNGSSADPTPW